MLKLINQAEACKKTEEGVSVIDFEASTGDLGHGPSTRWGSNHVVVGSTSDQGGPDEQCPRCSNDWPEPTTAERRSILVSVTSQAPSCRLFSCLVF